MSRSLRKISLIKLLVVILLASALVFSLMRTLDLRQQYCDGLEDLASRRLRVPQITLLRLKPDRAARESRSQVALAKTIEESATRSGLKPTQVVSIEPQSPRRVADTPYEEYATLVRIEAVTLGELAKLAEAIREESSADHPLQVSALRVAVPFQTGKSTDESVEAWNVELTLTYLVYSPKSRES
jgi:hypothetical protein